MGSPTQPNAAPTVIDLNTVPPEAVAAMLQRGWGNQHNNYSSPEKWVEHYQQSTEMPSRLAVLEFLHWLSPWHSLCELGCHAGPMLGMIAKEFPSARLVGCEVNPVAAHAAKRYLPQADIALESLEQWLDREESVDVIISHYTLAYIDPRILPGVLGKILQVAKHGIVLAEPMGNGFQNWEKPERFPEWHHDYFGPLSRLGIQIVQRSIQGCENLNGILAARV